MSVKFAQAWVTLTAIVLIALFVVWIDDHLDEVVEVLCRLKATLSVWWPVLRVVLILVWASVSVVAYRTLVGDIP